MRLGRKGPRAESCVVAHALRHSWGTLAAASAVSAAINVLALTGSVYALHVYNQILPSRSATALLALTLAMLALYTAAGRLDFLRQYLLSKAAQHLDRNLSPRVFAVQHLLALEAPRRGDGLGPMRDLDQIRVFLSSTGPTALFDLPFLPLYLGAIFFLHPLLGILAVAGAMLLIAIMLLAQARSTRLAGQTAHCAARRWTFAAAAYRNADAVRAMGFMVHLAQRWSEHNAEHRQAHHGAARIVDAGTAAIKAARPALQSGMLGLGAYLAIEGDGSAGTMIAASIILSRALAPVETAIANWRSFVAARQSHARLAALLAALPEHECQAPPRPAPRKSLRVESLRVTPPGARAPVLRGIGFALPAGAGLGVVGPSASGKSTLARALVGAWRAQAGCVRLDGDALDQWDPDALGCHVGYLPQDIALFDGTIADNIARFDAQATLSAVTAAARAAGIERMIETLPGGYRTGTGDNGTLLSAGQRQRVALARALYGEPFLVVLDEPDANLDAEGARGLTAAIASVRLRGGIVVVMAHRLAALSEVDQVLVLQRGRVAAFGPRDGVLARGLKPVTAAAE